MKRPIVVSESEYYEIMRWDDDGGSPIDIDYIIIPDCDESHERPSPKAEPSRRESGTTFRAIKSEYVELSGLPVNAATV